MRSVTDDVHSWLRAILLQCISGDCWTDMLPRTGARAARPPEAGADSEEFYHAAGQPRLSPPSRPLPSGVLLYSCILSDWDLMKRWQGGMSRISFGHTGLIGLAPSQSIVLNI